MLFIFTILFFSISSYLLGSIPTALWYGNRFHGQDIRTLGSGNAGATNTFRVFGKKAGTIVLILDGLKGLIAASFALVVCQFIPIDLSTYVSLKILFGFLAIIGHLLPIFCDFKGGKGVATLMGMSLFLHPNASLLSIGIFLIVFLISHYVSLSSMIASLSFPTLMEFETFGKEEPLMVVFGFFVTGIVFYTHRKNIDRILSGTENRMYFISKKR